MRAPRAIPAAWLPWETIARSLAPGPALTIFATEMAGWTASLHALENSGDWLAIEAARRSYIREHRPLGRALTLPTASYSEMMEWALPTKARSAFQAVSEEFANRADVERFLRGAPWRGFFSKYPESNLLHKKMLRISGMPSEPGLEA